MRDDFVKLDTLSPPAGGTDLSDLGRTLRKRWLVVVAVGATVFGGVAFSTLTTIPKYQSETLILLDKTLRLARISRRKFRFCGAILWWLRRLANFKPPTKMSLWEK